MQNQQIQEQKLINNIFQQKFTNFFKLGKCFYLMLIKIDHTLMPFIFYLFFSKNTKTHAKQNATL